MKFCIASLMASMATVATAQSVVSLHGSGTTNPSKCYWHIMDLLQTQTKIPTKMTYRAVGSSTGQAEFIGDATVPDNDFGSGDIPLSQSDFDLFPANSILHLPIVLGAISFFHSVPTGDKGLNLTPCVLAKILKRDITDWTDSEIKDLNPDLNLPGPYPITVAHRVLGSSSTASITQYLHEACPSEWPIELVGKTIVWEADTVGCEGSGGMTTCINSLQGTIGYIDSGHGHSEGLQEIELRNADGNYVSSKEAAKRGGIIAATEEANLPAELDGSFANVNLLNRAGPNTWPIVALSYIYVRKDLTYLTNPTSQGLLKAFLTALYTEKYISTCEEEFGFFRVTGALRDKALLAIEALTTSEGAPQFTFEFDTEKRTGQDDFKISVKRQSYVDFEQGQLVDQVREMEVTVANLLADFYRINEELVSIKGETDDHSHSASHSFADGDDEFRDFVDDEMDEDTQIKAALALGSISFILWMLALIYVLVKFVLRV